MRYFIGIVPPEKIKRKINSFRKEFKNNKLPKIFEPHITIKYRSGLADDMLWLDKVEPIIRKYPKFEVAFAGVGTFPDVVILKVEASEEITALHKALYYAIKPDESDPTLRCFENEKYIPHSTLGMVSWGMSREELSVMEDLAEKKLPTNVKFDVNFLRVYRQEQEDVPYKKLVDIPLYEL